MTEKGIEVAKSNLHDNQHVEGEVGLESDGQEKSYGRGAAGKRA